MAMENNWGAPRIHAELVKLGFDISQTTVSRYMPKPKNYKDKIKQWKAFLTNHRQEVAAMDIFTIPTASFKVLYGFFIIHHGRRLVLHFNITSYPTVDWIIQQLREAFPFDR